jgi:Ca2+-binding RTX toxin-like protein
MPVVQPEGAIRTLTSGTYVDSVFSSDGSLFYAVSGNSLTVFDVATGSAITSYTFGSSLGRLDISQDGAYLAIVEKQPGDGVGTVYRFSTATGAIETFALAGTSTLFDVAYLANGNLVVSQQVGAPLRSVSLDSGVFTTLGSVPWYASIAASADATYIIAQAAEVTWPIFAYDLESNSTYSALGNPSPYSGASVPPSGNGVGAISPDGSLVVQGMTGRVYDSTLSTYFQLGSLDPDLRQVVGMTFSADGGTLYMVSATTDRLFAISTETWQVTARYHVGADVSPIIELRVSDDGNFVAIITAAGIQLINIDLAVPYAIPTQGNDDLSGEGANDRIEGLAGADLIDGGAGDDLLGSHAIGGMWNDHSLDIYADRDSVFGGAGSDSIFAGYGDDVDGGTDGYNGDSLFISFLGAPGGVTVDFSLATQVIGGGTITGIENLRWVQGSGFDDVINAADNAAFYVGGSQVFGMGGNDHLIAGFYTNLLSGGDGDDLLDGRLGQGVAIYGGAGNDTIHSLHGVAYGDAGEDVIYASTSAFGGVGNDRITLLSSATNSRMFGDDGDDIIDGGASANGNYIIGGHGADTLTGGNGSDRIGSATAGVYGDTPDLDMGAERDVIIAGGGNDFIWAGYGDSVDGGAGHDQLRLSLAGAPMGVDVDMAVFYSGIPVTIGDTTIYNTESLDFFRGTDFADTITAWSTSTYFSFDAGGGDDVIFTNRGGFTVTGGDGDDRFVSIINSEDYGNTFWGGAGNDTLDFRDNRFGLTISLAENGHYYSPFGLEAHDVENLAGGAYDDMFLGNEVANVLEGRGGNDVLYGGGGNDTLTGGAGWDQLSGGSGFDTFRDTAAGLHGDNITDLALGESIVISDANLATFNYSLSGITLSYTGGSLVFGGGLNGRLVAQAAAGGGVQLTLVPNNTRNDFNGDARSDILWRHDSGVVMQWLGQADGSFMWDQAISYALPADWSMAGIGDFNGDGRFDVVWRHDGGNIIEWLGQANGTLANNAAAGGNLGLNWQVSGVADFNGDNRDDILWRSETGVTQTWLAQANGSFVTSAASYAMPTDWTLAAAADFTGDGRSDILWRHDSGVVIQWVGQSDGSFAWDENISYALPTDWALSGAGDFNGDGRTDLVWRHTTGNVIEWLGQANGSFLNNPAANSSLAPSWHFDGIGDFNGDGRDDLVWRNDDGAMTIWRGQADGSFLPSAAVYQMPTDWTVQPESPWI